jgi:hypothetical protein
MEQLARLGITRVEHVTARSIGTKSSLALLLAPVAAPVNSDFRPVVQIEAPRARYEAQAATAVLTFSQTTLPIAEMLAGQPRVFFPEPVFDHDPSSRLRLQSAALRLGRALLDPGADPLAPANDVIRLPLLVLKQRGALCGKEPAQAVLEQLQLAAELTLTNTAPDLRRRLWITNEWVGCAPDKVAPRLRRRLGVYAAIAAQDGRTMLERARALLSDPSETGGDWRRFLLVAAMVGAEASGASEEVGPLWSKYRKALYADGAVPLHIVYVVNHAAELRASP